MSDLHSEILELKKAQNAVILAHNYVMPELQDLADFVGDSLELSIKARDNQAETIVFCGVRFMAETAKLLSPKARVLMPNKAAGCPMADQITPERLKAYREANPDDLIIAYVNTTAATKAYVDVCVTSGNAERVISQLPKEQAKMFLPDRNLGDYINKRLGISMKLWEGYCPIHDALKLSALEDAHQEHPNAEIIVHPECRPEIIARADAALSTSQMIRHAQASKNNEFIVCTELGLIYRLRLENPGKHFYHVAPPLICPDMKVTTIADLHRSLRDGLYEITLPQDIMERAVKPIHRMLEMS